MPAEVTLRLHMTRADRLAVAALLVAAGAFVTSWDRVSELAGGVRAFDIYQYYFPNMLYALARLRDGGQGLLWNPFNDCGQPFLGTSSTGVLYPASTFFLWLRPDRALLAVIAFNLAVGGVSAYGLGRVLGLGSLGATALALAYEFGNVNMDLATWSPLVGSAYAWVPAIMLCTEWGLRRPGLRPAVALGVVAAVALLPGFPQQVLLAYQLAGLRLVWALVSRESRPAWRSLLTVVAGLLLGPLLAAALLVPGLETAALSVRARALAPDEIMPGGFLTIARLRYLIALRSDIVNPLRLMPWTLAVASLAGGSSRRALLFYLLAGLFFTDLSFGLNGHLFATYQNLPLGTLFRDPARFMWIVSLCLAVLVGLAVDAFSGRDARPRLVHRLLLGGTVLAGLATFRWLAPYGLNGDEWWLVWVSVAAILLTQVPRARFLAAPVLLVALALDLFVLRPAPVRRLLQDWTIVHEYAGPFHRLRALRTPQDRVYVMGDPHQYTLMQKTPTLFGIPSVHDYEPQPSARWAEFYVMMRNGSPMKNLNSFYYVLGYAVWNRRLFDLTAARFVAMNVPEPELRNLAGPPLRLLEQAPGVSTYENTQAGPRAFYVSRLAVVPEPAALLQRLATGPDDLRQMALVEAEPPSGFLGDAGPSVPGTVTFVTDEPEHVVLRVTSSARGFLVLIDQDLPGWQATVNGAPADILRADYAFRAVEVPAGMAQVEFRYAPASVRIGTTVSAVTVAGLLALAAVRRRRASRLRLHRSQAVV